MAQCAVRKGKWGQEPRVRASDFIPASVAKEWDIDIFTTSVGDISGERVRKRLVLKKIQQVLRDAAGLGDGAWEPEFPTMRVPVSGGARTSRVPGTRPMETGQNSDCSAPGGKAEFECWG